MCRLFLHDLAERAKCGFRGTAKKARAEQIAEFTGISSPYEAPENPELTVNTGAAEPVTVGWARPTM